MTLTENRFRELFNDFGNCSESYISGERFVIYTFCKKSDNKFNISYHLTFPLSDAQFNFWFDKISYLNSQESVTISFYNGKEKDFKNQLKNICRTNSYEELKSKIDEILTQYTPNNN